MAWRARRLWIVGWILALVAMYVCVIGQDAFLPIYFAEDVLGLFAVALTVRRLLEVNDQEEMGVLLHMLIYVAAVVAGFAVGALAPTIGEPDYCAAVTWAKGLPPKVFRCVWAPFAFAGFVGGYWALTWVLMRVRAARR